MAFREPEAGNADPAKEKKVRLCLTFVTLESVPSASLQPVLDSRVTLTVKPDSNAREHCLPSDGALGVPRAR